MIQNSRTCQQKGHEQYNSNLVCTFKNCTETIKWVCQECLRKQIHLHGQASHDHLMNQQEFLEYLMNNNQMDVIEQCQMQISSLIKALNKFLSHLNNNYELKAIIEKVNEDFLSLSNEQIGMAQKKQKYDFKQINENFQNVIQSAKVLEELIDVKKFSITVEQSKIKQIFKTLNHHQQQINQQSFINNFSDININSTINQNMLRRSICNTIKIFNSNFEYQNYIQLVKEEQQIHYAQISQNEQYFALCQDDKLVIYHLEEKNQLKEITFEKDIQFCLFGQKSTILYVSCNDGFLYSVELDDFYKLTQIHQDNKSFQCFVEKSSLKLFSNNERNIYEIDFKKQAIDLKIEEAHQAQIVQIEFDRINKIIVSCSNNDSIKFFSEKGQVIINHQQENQNKIKQIQLINNNQQLLILCIDGIMYLWQICLEKRQILLTEQFISQQQTLSFNSVYNDKFIITQSNSTMDIIDSKFNHIKQIYCSQNDQLQGISQNLLLNFQIIYMSDKSIP